MDDVDLIKAFSTKVAKVRRKEGSLDCQRWMKLNETANKRGH